MNFLNTDIHDGEIFQEFYLDLNKPLNEQWPYLHDDIGTVFFIRGDIRYEIDISWKGSWDNIPESFFIVKIYILDLNNEFGDEIYHNSNIKPNFQDLILEFNKAYLYIKEIWKLSKDDIIKKYELL
jgi:hypothetical protein